MPEFDAADLRLDRITYGKAETPWTLLPLLYRGGANANARKVAGLISNGMLGTRRTSRLELLKLLHDEIDAELASGRSPATVDTHIRILRSFYSWGDRTGKSLTTKSVEADCIEYCEHLFYRFRTKKDLTSEMAASYASVSSLIARALDLAVPPLAKTNIVFPKTKKSVLGTQADKQNLEQTFAFGHFLVDLSEALTVGAIRGRIPLVITLRSGEKLEEWCGYRKKTRTEEISQGHSSPHFFQLLLARREALDADTSNRTRHPLINLRIEAEMLIFIAQTGMNLAQANSMKIGVFRYQSHLDGYKVYRVYKGRREGEVEFEIFEEYRPYFERYMDWRAQVVPAAEDRLFPQIARAGRPSNPRTPHQFQSIAQRCRRLGIKCFRPQSLRNTRVNWILRRTRDPHLTAEISQHSLGTLFRNYEKPHHQVAIAEISRFHAASDPALRMPGAGLCVKRVPLPIINIPVHAAKPDCLSPAGCLFCQHQRDIDSFDHVWSLTSYRHLKSLELARYRPPEVPESSHPAMAAIELVTAKLRRFEESSPIRAQWTMEASTRMAESDYHPMWDGFIQLLEVCS